MIYSICIKFLTHVLVSTVEMVYAQCLTMVHLNAYVMSDSVENSVHNVSVLEDSQLVISLLGSVPGRNYYFLTVYELSLPDF